MSFASEGRADTGPYLPAQAAADQIRSAASAEIGFVAAGLIGDGYTKDKDLASLMLYPQEQIVIVKLTGTEIREALERSVSLYPQPNTGFLQVSGIEVSFRPSAPSGSRVVSASVGGSKLEAARVYSVAMPSSLGRGGCGYFNIWDKKKIAKTFETDTVESVLKGKRYVDTAPRWLPLQ